MICNTDRCTFEKDFTCKSVQWQQEKLKMVKDLKQILLLLLWFGFWGKYHQGLNTVKLLSYQVLIEYLLYFRQCTGCWILPNVILCFAWFFVKAEYYSGWEKYLVICFWEIAVEWNGNLYICIGYVCARGLNRVWLFMTPWTVAYQAPLSTGFPR